MDFITGLILVLLVVISWYVINKMKESADMPPGPFSLPLIGSPWILFKDFHIVFTEMAKTLGPVFSANIFGDRMVVLNTTEAVREVFAEQKQWKSFNGRPFVPFQNEHMAKTTVFLPPYSQWSKQRRLVHKILSVYGERLEGTEASIQDELTHVTNFLKKKGQSIDLNEVLFDSLINVITILLKGRRYEYGSLVLNNVIALDEILSEFADPRNNFFLTVLPFLKYIPYGPGKMVYDFDKILNQFLKDYFEEEKATYDPSVNRGMIDFLFQHQSESRLPDGSVWLGDEPIKSIILETIGAGSTTTRVSLYAFFLIIAKQPDVAKRIQDEVDRVIGPDRFSKLQDRANMPYTMAAIFELLRYISHLPLLVPHVALDDVTYKGYHIPRKTMLFSNMWSIHHDPKLWDDPWEFKPERFLDPEGHLLPADHQTRKNLMPFGIGRRSCIGETFARSRMFLFITTLLQRFNFRPDPSKPLPPSDPRTYRPGAVLCPQHYSLSVTPRS